MIWFLRGNKKAFDVVMREMPFSISIVTYMEIVQGMRNKQELEKMKKAFKSMDIHVIPINDSISFRAADYVEKYSLGSSVELADALIASTCVEWNAALYTANDKHYRVIEELDLKIFRP